MTLNLLLLIGNYSSKRLEKCKYFKMIKTNNVKQP